jgi:pyrimidine-nucleoside phosphorylase
VRAVDLIIRKRDGFELTNEEIRHFVQGLLTGEIPDYQASAMCMAIFFRGLSERETSALTLEMMRSGDTIDLSRVRGFKVDKHSTGGVGDKTTLVVAPLVASLGVSVAKMSGRGLGHTGGTIDKLESIPSFSTAMTSERFIESVNRIQIAVVGQSHDLAPADRILYALRDVTGTVESIPLIASSIMSKKLAAGADGIVLDVKCGRGAFMKSLEDARKLARTMVAIGTSLGRKTDALISSMDQPLGRAVGNSLEVSEAIATLKGEGPADFTRLCLEVAARMLLLAGPSRSLEECAERARRSLESGTALEKFRQFIGNQGGNPDVCDRPDLMPAAAYKEVLTSARDGFVCRCDALSVGRASMILGAGRNRKDDVIDHSAGVILHKKIGDHLDAGEPLVTMLTNRRDSLEEARAVLAGAFDVSDQPVKAPDIILDPLRIFSDSSE